MKTYNEKLAQAIGTFFQVTQGPKYDFDQENGVLHFSIEINGKMRTLLCAICMEEDDFMTFVTYPVGGDPSDKEMMLCLSEFLLRANYNLKMGSFQLNWEDGKVRFKLFTNCEGSLPMEEIIQQGIMYPLIMCEHYGDGFLDVIFGGVSPQEAVERCEKRLNKV